MSVLESAASGSRVSARAFGLVQKRANDGTRPSTPSNSTKGWTSKMKIDSHRKLLVPFPSVFHDVRLLFFHSPSTFHTTPHETDDSNGRYSVLYGRTGLTTRLHPISERRTPPDRPIREKLTLREATLSALNTLVSGLPYQVIWLSAYAAHATSCKTCESLYSQLINGRVVYTVKARMLSASG
jgi:hypothetical protein